MEIRGGVEEVSEHCHICHVQNNIIVRVCGEKVMGGIIDILPAGGELHSLDEHARLIIVHELENHIVSCLQHGIPDVELRGGALDYNGCTVCIDGRVMDGNGCPVVAYAENAEALAGEHRSVLNLRPGTLGHAPDDQGVAVDMDPAVVEGHHVPVSNAE